MTARHDDSVLTSIREIQRLEEERLRENARRAEAAERDRVARAETARLEAEREVAARAAALEAERVAEQRRRDESERKEREAREARELTIRAEADAERALRAQRLADEHAQAMAAIEAERNRGVQAPKAVAMVLAAVALTGAVGWFGVYVPHQRQHAAEVSSIAYRAQAAQRERDRVQQEADALAARLRNAARTAPPPSPVATVATPTPAPRTAPRTPARVRQQTQQAAPEVIEIGGGDDPFAMDDGARGTTGRPRR